VSANAASRRHTSAAARDAFDASPSWFDVEQFCLALDTVPVIGWVVDDELRIVHAFGQGLRSIGVEPGSMVGRALADAFECAPSDEMVVATTAALGGGSRQFDSVWADRLYEAGVRPLYDANQRVAGAFGIALDVTERVESTDRLRRFTAIVDAADDAIVSLGRDGRVRTWNRGAEALFGPQALTVAGQPFADLFQESDEIHRHLDRVLTGERLLAHDTTWTPRAQPEPRAVSVSLTPIRNGAGHTIGATAVIRARIFKAGHEEHEDA